MPTVKKTCRVCGKSYEACRTAKRDLTGVFHWQEVACSPECGAEYLRQVTEARNPAPKAKRGYRAKVMVVDEVAETLPEEASADSPAE